MLKTIAAFDRIGEEMFAGPAVLRCPAQGKAPRAASASPICFGTPDFMIVEAGHQALRDYDWLYAGGRIPSSSRGVLICTSVSTSRCPPATIMPGEPTMFMLILMFASPASTSSIRTAGLPIYRSMIENTGARPIPVPIREEKGFASADGRPEADHARKKMPADYDGRPANPTGGVTPSSSIELVGGYWRNFPGGGPGCLDDYDHMTDDGENTHVPPVSRSVDPRPADPRCTRWSKSRHDRLGGWLRAAGSTTRSSPTRHSRATSAQYAGLAALHPPAGRGDQDGRRVRQAPEGRGRRSIVARRVLRDPRRVDAFPKVNTGRKAKESYRAAERHRRGHHWRARTS